MKNLGHHAPRSFAHPALQPRPKKPARPRARSTLRKIERTTAPPAEPETEDDTT